MIPNEAVFVILVGVAAVLECAWFAFTMPTYRKAFALFVSDGTLRIRSVISAILSYTTLAVGTLAFVVLPIYTSSCTGYLKAFSTGALFGFAVYGVYNFTNKATIPGYPWSMVIMDTLWGSFLIAIIATLTVAIRAL